MNAAVVVLEQFGPADDIIVGFRFDQTILDWADTIDPSWLAADLTYYSFAIQREVTQPNWVLVAHLFNHQTHHRGQVHCMLTQAGQRPSDTDLPFMPE